MTRTWRRVRLQVLQQEPLCRTCQTQGKWTLAEEVDHVVPLCEGGSRLDLSNLTPTCADCHRRKTHDDKRRRAEGAGVPQGRSIV
jgi:5-methylcytosine-specific restriction enzyme A